MIICVKSITLPHLFREVGESNYLLIFRHIGRSWDYRAKLADQHKLTMLSYRVFVMVSSSGDRYEELGCKLIINLQINSLASIFVAKFGCALD